MKRRHAAALALIGWYLMIVQHTHFASPSDQAVVVQRLADAEPSYETKDECLTAKNHWLLQRRVASGANDPRFETLMFDNSLECVASDDPRLKAKQPLPAQKSGNSR